MPLIHHTFGPHVTASTACKALKYLFLPWTWRGKKHVFALRSDLEDTFEQSAHLFSKGREALLALLQAMDIGAGDEVIIQGYTCTVVPAAIQATGAVPVYADCSLTSLNLTVDTVSAVCTDRTKAVICQHTFGIPADCTGLKHLCDQKGIALIEDCAHRIDTDAYSPLGRTGHATILSFGRDKAISGITGGVVLTQNEEWSGRLDLLQQDMQELSLLSIKRLLLYPVLYAICRPLYAVFIGKLLLALCGKLRILPAIVRAEEKQGQMEHTLFALPNPCAALARRSLAKLTQLNKHRSLLTSLYKEEKLDGPTIPQKTPLQKFPIFVRNPDEIRTKLKKKNIYLDDGWSCAVVCPRGSNAKALGYKKGSCPNAERVARTILSLPTHANMTQRDATHLLTTLRKALTPNS